LVIQVGFSSKVCSFFLVWSVEKKRKSEKESKRKEKERKEKE
jgi:hypothetical protein